MLPTPETFEVRLVEASMMTPRVRRMVFERVGAPFHFLAGQWVQLRFPLQDEKGRPLKRAYSIASPPDGARFELAVTHVDEGQGSGFLHELPVGGVLEAMGPHGSFIRPLETAAPALFIATGTGLAPFRAMVHDAVRAGRREPLWVLFGVRAPSEVLWEDELRALEQAHPWLRLVVTLSRPPPEWTGRTGHVQQHVRALWEELVATSATPPDAWMCGVQAMLDDVRVILRQELGLPRQRVHAESYG